MGSVGKFISLAHINFRWTHNYANRMLLRFPPFGSACGFPAYFFRSESIGWQVGNKVFKLLNVCGPMIGEMC